MKTKENTCQRCKGSGSLEGDLMNHGSKSLERHIFGCDVCEGKGWRGDEPGRVYASVTYPNEKPYGA